MESGAKVAYLVTTTTPTQAPTSRAVSMAPILEGSTPSRITLLKNQIPVVKGRTRARKVDMVMPMPTPTFQEYLEVLNNMTVGPDKFIISI